MEHDAPAVNAVPDISVVVPSHNRPLRLRWLLNALEEQTLERGRWEVVVCHDSSGPETEDLLRTHALAADGTLRHETMPVDSASSGRKRNIAWRMARAPLVVFTDDDCRPPPDWLERAVAAAAGHPGAIVQGATGKDPLESAMQHAPYYHSQLVRPPTPWAETCNIVYPKELLERAGGFIEEHSVGEDTDLALRCRELGADYVAAPEVLTYHAVIELSLREALRVRRRWQDLPDMIKRHPEMRRHYPLGMFWTRRHAWLPLFAAGVVLMGRRRAWTVLCVPYLVHAVPAHGSNPRGRYRNLAELPSRLLLDVFEMAVIARGSVRHRTLFL